MSTCRGGMAGAGRWLLVAGLCLLATTTRSAATTWRGTTEATYQALPVDGGHADFWREFIQLRAEDRLFVKNRLELSLRIENRSFGGRQPSQLRPRWDLEVSGQSYNFKGFYAPFTLERDTLPDQSESRYNLSFAMFPVDYPRVTLSYDGLSRTLEGEEPSRRSTYTLTSSYAYRDWHADARLLRQDLKSPGGGVRDRLEAILLRNDFNHRLGGAHMSLGHRYEYTERKRTPGLPSYSAVNNLVATAAVPLTARLRASADYSGRFIHLSGGGGGRTTAEHIASGLLTYRPFDFFEVSGLRYYADSDKADADDRTADFYQLRAGLNGRLFTSVTGLFSVYRTWNRHAVGEGDVNDAVYLQTTGYLYPEVRFSVETSWSDRNIGARPVSIVRAFGLRMRPARRSEWQVDYASQGTTDRWRLAAIDRQNVNLVVQQGITDHVRFSVGRGFIQDRSVAHDWQGRWLVTGQLAARRLFLLTGNYNRLETIRPVPGGEAVSETTRRKNVQITIYPERRLLVTVGASEDVRADGQARTTWRGDLRYQF